jgi:hypothetical protein
MASACVSCSVNVLTPFAKKTTDDALYEDALADINSGDYNGALTQISNMTSAYQGKRTVVTLKASAYAGLCGMNFLSFVKDLGNMGSTRLFPFLVSEFKGGTTARIDACRSAQDLMTSIGTVSERTNDENMFLVLLSFAKIGNVLSLYTDVDQDGTPDAGVNPCTFTPRATRPTSPVAGDWYDDTTNKTGDLREIGTGIALALANIAAVSSTVNLGTGSLSSVNSVCSAVPAAYDFCSITDGTQFTASQLKGIMTLLKESSVVGLGTNCTGDVTACFCP